jgi:delta 1-pyrroline-5-carboxylate dehydrogenase
LTSDFELFNFYFSGGARASGTNDKAGGPHYVLKWASPQTIKEGKMPLNEWRKFLLYLTFIYICF